MVVKFQVKIETIIYYTCIPWSMRAVEKGVEKIEAYSKMDAATIVKTFNTEYMAKPLEEKEIDNTILKSTDREYKYSLQKPPIKNIVMHLHVLDMYVE